jgi:hypothetical protein
MKIIFCISLFLGLVCSTYAHPGPEKHGHYKHHKAYNEQKSYICEKHYNGPNDGTLPPVSVPEPGSTATLLGLALTALGFMRKRI